jgi:hypothetical protein
MSVWRRFPGWLGIGGALAALFSSTLASFSPVGDCAGTLIGFGGTAATLGALALVGFLALLWLSQRRNMTFAVALALYLLAGVGLLVATPNILHPACASIGGYRSGLTLLIVGLVAIAVASLWQTLAMLPGAPWPQLIAAALGLFGFFAVPWDLSATPGVVDFWNGATCTFSDMNAVFLGQSTCIQFGTDLSPSQLVRHEMIPTNMPFYINQIGLLAIVSVLALLALRWRTAGALRSLRAMSLFTGMVGVLTGLILEYSVAVELISPGAAVVGLAFLLLAIVGGRGWRRASVAPLERPVYNVATKTNTAGRL